MPNFHGVEVSSDKLKAYQTQDLDYKAQAREIVCHRLNYDPPIELSVLGELRIRDALKRCEAGEISKTDLDNMIAFHIDVIRSVMLECAQAGTA